MRLHLLISCDLIDPLRRLAIKDFRTVRQEAEWLLNRAIEQAVREHPCGRVLTSPEMEPVVIGDER